MNNPSINLLKRLWRRFQKLNLAIRLFVYATLITFLTVLVQIGYTHYTNKNRDEQIKTLTEKFDLYPGALTEARPEIKDPYLKGLRAIENAKYKEAESYLKEAYGETENEKTKAALDEALGKVLYSLSRYKEAENHFRRALLFYNNYGDDLGKTWALNGLGLIDYDKGKYEGAIAKHEEGLEYALKINGEKAIAAHYGNMGLNKIYFGKIEEGLGDIFEAWAISQKIGYERGESAFFGNIAWLLFFKGDIEKAKYFEKKSIAIARNTGDRYTEALVLINAGTTDLNVGDTSAATKKYYRALEIFRDIGCLKGEAFALSNLGLLISAEGKNDEAHILIEKSLEIHETIGTRLGTGHAFASLGWVYCSERDFEKALTAHKKAHYIYKDIGHKIYEALNLERIGEINGIIGNYDEGISSFSAASLIYHDLGNYKAEARNQSKIGSELMQKNDLIGALDVLNKALLINRLHGNEAGIAREYGKIGLIYLSLGYYETAASYLRESLNKSRELGLKRDEITNLINLSIISAYYGDFDGALDLLYEAQLVSDNAGYEYGKTYVFKNIGLIYLSKGEIHDALVYFQRALDCAYLSCTPSEIKELEYLVDTVEKLLEVPG